MIVGWRIVSGEMLAFKLVGLYPFNFARSFIGKSSVKRLVFLSGATLVSREAFGKCGLFHVAVVGNWCCFFFPWIFMVTREHLQLALTVSWNCFGIMSAEIHGVVIASLDLFFVKLDVITRGIFSFWLNVTTGPDFEQCSGCCSFIWMEVFVLVGLFSEDFPDSVLPVLSLYSSLNENLIFVGG